MSNIHLRPTASATGKNNQFTALSAEPWLSLETNIDLSDGPWVEIIYSASYLDVLARPILRCLNENGYEDEILTSPVFGRAIWRGPIPSGTRSLQISPTNQTGPFTFQIETFRLIPKLELMIRAARKRPLKAILGVAAHLAGLDYLSKVAFRHAVGPTPLAKYHSWREMRYRAFDPAGLDQTHINISDLPTIILICTASQPDDPALKQLIKQLQAQDYPDWRLLVQSTTSTDAACPAKDSRMISCANLTEAFSDLPDTALVIELPVGALLEPSALAVIGLAAAKHPATDLFYADTDELSANHRYKSPHFRPNFDPLLFANQDYLGEACFIRLRLLRKLGDLNASAQNSRARIQKNTLTHDVALHVARVVMTLTEQSAKNSFPEINSKPTVPETASPGRTCIIIPTKDQYALLRRCIDSVRQYCDPSQIELVVVDNGSTNPDAITYLKALATEPATKVLNRPGPFNFSRLCNEGASLTEAPFLVFLNNDTELTEHGWLESLLHLAASPDIGAVGAKLLYNNRKIQHGGVILGLDGRAGHFERLIGEEDPGYFGRLNLPHEIAAVTGACLAVEAQKFKIIGGFDEKNLPVDLNDIDLCLRLAERGWKPVLAGHVTILHHESASRSGSWRPDKVYAMERAYFKKRWIAKLRESPNFHPALTMEGFRAALG